MFFEVLVIFTAFISFLSLVGVVFIVHILLELYKIISELLESYSQILSEEKENE